MHITLILRVPHKDGEGPQGEDSFYFLYGLGSAARVALVEVYHNDLERSQIEEG